MHKLQEPRRRNISYSCVFLLFSCRHPCSSWGRCDIGLVSFGSGRDDPTTLFTKLAMRLLENSCRCQGMTPGWLDKGLSVNRDRAVGLELVGSKMSGNGSVGDARVTAAD